MKGSSLKQVASSHGRMKENSRHFLQWMVRVCRIHESTQTRDSCQVILGDIAFLPQIIPEMIELKGAITPLNALPVTLPNGGKMLTATMEFPIKVRVLRLGFSQKGGQET